MGKIKNVVDFGAFVDLGIKETALAHISELSDQFIKDPLDAVKAGDVLEFRIIGLDQDRRRIALSRKSGASRSAFGSEQKPAGGERRKIPAGGKSWTNTAGDSGGGPCSPFAEAFRKAEERKKRKK